MLVDQFLAKKVPAEKITVLAYYKGQLALVAHKIEMATDANGRNWSLNSGTKISSVDSFQGEENEYVIVDIVSAPIRETGRQMHKVDEDDDREEGSEPHKATSRVTRYVKSPNRLCCALTRGRQCVVVVGQLEALYSTVKSVQTVANATLGALAKDFEDRKLVSSDHTTLDSNPAGQATREKWDKATQEAELQRHKDASLIYISNQDLNATRMRVSEGLRSNAPRVYRTGNRRTTRPNQTGEVAQAAEAHDNQNRPTLQTGAGLVTVKTGGQSQHSNKASKKAADEAKKTETEEAEKAKKVVRMAPEEGKGKGKANDAPAPPEQAPATPVEGKGKGKEDAMDTTS